MKPINCLKCGKKISKNCKTGICGSCRDRRGINNPFYGKHHTQETKDKAKPKNILASKLLWQKQEYRDKVIRGVSKPRREGFGEEQSVRITQWYVDNPEQREIRSISMRKAWIDGKIEPNINSINESKLELELKDILVTLLPEHSVVKKTIRIGKKWFHPDIVIDDDIIIEFYGNYWHANPSIYNDCDIIHHNKTAESIWQDDRRRLDILQKNGYNVFIVWQDEYVKDKESVINNLLLEITSYGKDKDN